MDNFVLEKSSGRITVELQAIPMGKDFCFVITGGILPHLGAFGNGKTVFTYPTHKENFVVELLAPIFAEKLSGNFVICCGIHEDNITKEEISSVLELCKKLAVEFLEEIK